MRILRLAAALLAACVLAGSTGAAVAVAQPGCPDLQGVVGHDQICRVHVSEPDVHARLELSQRLSRPAVVGRLPDPGARRLRQCRQDPDAYNLPYELDAEGTGYRSGSDTPGGGTRSVVFTMWQNVGGTHPQTYYQSFNWNVAANAPITFDTLFKPGTKPLDVIYPEVNRYLGRTRD